MSYQQAREVIWAPDHHALEEVAEAAEVVLSERRAHSMEIYQATYLITTFRLR